MFVRLCVCPRACLFACVFGRVGDGLFLGVCVYSCCGSFVCVCLNVCLLVCVCA